jgi:hypothetical protein
VDETGEALYRKRFTQAEKSAAAQFERDAGRRMNITKNQRDKGWLFARASLRAAPSDRSPPKVERGFVESLSATELPDSQSTLRVSCHNLPPDLLAVGVSIRIGHRWSPGYGLRWPDLDRSPAKNEDGVRRTDTKNLRRACAQQATSTTWPV